MAEQNMLQEAMVELLAKKLPLALDHDGYRGLSVAAGLTRSEVHRGVKTLLEQGRAKLEITGSSIRVCGKSASGEDSRR